MGGMVYTYWRCDGWYGLHLLEVVGGMVYTYWRCDGWYGLHLLEVVGGMVTLTGGDGWYGLHLLEVWWVVWLHLLEV